MISIWQHWIQLAETVHRCDEQELRGFTTWLTLSPCRPAVSNPEHCVAYDASLQFTMPVNLKKWMMDETQHEFTRNGALEGHTIKHVCQWIKQSWSRVREDIIVKSFKKCGVSNAADGSEDHSLYEEDNDDEEESSDDDIPEILKI
ncbi:hypothetical protein L9F63_012086 [Diploptera punctata]|uniref:DDE-1 domain-containing protein n=1 Tax=Diploptera punctata TaxID=6984 RepID=A0AAD8EN29_DIPPU|nr:hypothetical protein L9F63_012086 [Diploptera punctata]